MLEPINGMGMLPVGMRGQAAFTVMVDICQRLGVRLVINGSVQVLPAELGANTIEVNPPEQQKPKLEVVPPAEQQLQ